ncbi:MAG: T9SS type A sorting domain-containing protein [Saprospiraceae bacterium]|nr:T9SS type A sorting domain-containing protein [Saprospiraceae bacterium]
MTTGETGLINLAIGQKIDNIDAGLYRRASIGDFVWDDQNGNGIQEAGEPGISGVVVRLNSITSPSSPPLETTTNANGIYSFDNLKPGLYSISFGKVSDYQITTLRAGTDTTKDNDADTNGLANNISLISGMSRTDIDAGYVSTSTAGIGDFVWEDLNGNGMQDDGESGIRGVKVMISGTSSSGVSVSDSVRTDINGKYLFSNLSSGTYTITFIKPEGYFFTEPKLGTEDIDSDANVESGKTLLFTIQTGQILKDIDAGMYRLGSIGDFVWNDLNGNGLQDFGEPGITGVTFTLINETDATVGSTTSGNFGFYFFSNLKPGKYRIETQTPLGFILTVNNNSNLTLNSDFADVNGVLSSPVINVQSNSFISEIDLGLRASKGSIEGILWKDINGNGIKDISEPVVESSIVILTNAAGAIIQMDTSDINGNYRFRDLDASQYIVRFSKQANMFFTYFQTGNDAFNDSDVGDDSGKTDLITIIGGAQIKGVNAGYVNSSSIGDFVWIDSNKDGIQSPGEVGLNGVKIRLLNENGETIDSIISAIKGANSGNYSFSGIKYGNYIIEFSLPDNFEYTELSLADTLTNSDIIDNLTGRTALIKLLPSMDRNDIDGGYILMAPVNGSISGLVWQDGNNNKIRDNNELLLPGINVSLFNINGSLVDIKVSDADGAYSFTNVPFGDYYISVPMVVDKSYVLYLGTPASNDSDISNDFGVGTTRILNLLPGTNITNFDLGYYPNISIGDFVWDDLNNNGLQDVGEPGIASLTVSLINEKGVLEKTTMTDSTGKYSFSNIAVGKYKITFSKLSGYVFAINNTVDINKNSKAGSESGETELLDFFIQQAYTNIDAGYVKTGSIGHRVWLDLNGNGFFQTGEPGIANIKVKLFNTSGKLLDSTTTTIEPGSDFTGYYRFTNVRPTDYYVKFELPAIYLISPSGVGGDDNDSNITDENGLLTTGIFTVQAGQFVGNIDAAAYLPASIGDRVWNDINKNGAQDSGEPGIGGISVKLFTQSGQLVASQVTNGQGLYLFGNLKQRLYYLQFSLPDGFEFTLQNASGSSMTDSDVDPTGTTPLISLAHGSVLLDIDAGMHSTNARIVMGNVWNDTNKNGIRSEDEKLQSGITVHLKDTGLGTVKTVVTNHAGMYALSTTKIGEHKVVVEAPDNNVFTQKRVGNSPDIDSDVDENGESDPLMLDDNYKMKYVDAGYYFKLISSINGIVWKDANKNGIRDDKDVPMPNVVIFLYNKSRIFVKSTKSNDNGEYSLKNLDPGQYYCKLPEFPDLDYVMFTGDNQDRDSEITNQYGPGTSRLLTIEAGVPFINFDFGFRDLNRFADTDPNRDVVYGVYPNPAVNQINVKISFDTESITEYYIVNNIGSVVKKGQIHKSNEVLDIDYLPSGRYTIHFVNTQEKVMRSFVKIDN